MNKGQREVIDAFMSVLPGKSSNLFDGVGRMFKQMETAEKEIERAILAQSDMGMQGVLFNSFMLIKPTWPVDEGYDDCIYRAHCRELLDRLAAGVSSESGLSRITWAEILVVVSAASYRVPMNNDGAAIVAVILRGVRDTLGSLPAALEGVLEEMSEFSPSYQDFADVTVGKMRNGIVGKRTLPGWVDIPTARREELGLTHEQNLKVMQPRLF